jgi:hypothetical protein
MEEDNTTIAKPSKKEIKVVFGDINKNNFEQLRQMNNLSLPVRYQNGFYARIVAKLRFGKFAYYNDIIVGGITWKYDNYENQRIIYIMTINVFEQYKRHNIGIIFKFILFSRFPVTRGTNQNS